MAVGWAITEWLPQWRRRRRTRRENAAAPAPPAVDLLPAPDDAWTVRYQALLADPFLAAKYDRNRRLAEKWEYLRRYLPELVSGELSGRVVDIGPGPGEFLELCRRLGCDVLGVDAATGQGGMGDPYLELSRLLCRRQQVPVEYVGFGAWRAAARQTVAPGSLALINSQGAIEQACCEWLDGPPHESHHDCRRLRWRNGPALREFFRTMLADFRRWLAPGGVVLIYANGAANTRAYDRQIVAAAEEAGGLRLVLRQKRLHKWVRAAA